MYDDSDWKSPHTMRYNKNCLVCQLLFQGYSEPLIGPIIRLRSESFLNNNVLFDKYDPAVQDSTVLMAVDGERVFTTNNVFCIPTGARVDNEYISKPVQQTWDLATEQSWLTVCMQCHTSLCRQENLGVPGMNLIDCVDLVLVKASPSSRWLALSYVWGANYQATP
jgi:hypothetical protein